MDEKTDAELGKELREHLDNYVECVKTGNSHLSAYDLPVTAERPGVVVVMNRHLFDLILKAVKNAYGVGEDWEQN